jgi:GNAT superfamily N-acetyltransferase
MGVNYVRRFRMEFDFATTHLSQPVLPDGYRWVPWQDRLLERHAMTKFESFQYEIDSRVFPCLGDLDGCRALMGEISRQRGFLPGATWLITHRTEPEDHVWRQPVDCGTIQGLAPSINLGAVQNVGIVPEHRGLGLGKALVLKSLHGFRRAGMQRVYLEVTADNTPAVELYRTIGFRLKRTMFKAVEFEPAQVS